MTSTATDHPSAADLVAFALGNLGRATAAPIENHLETCEECCRVVAAAGDDPLLTLVRSSLLKAPAG